MNQSVSFVPLPRRARRQAADRLTFQLTAPSSTLVRQSAAISADRCHDEGHGIDGAPGDRFDMKGRTVTVTPMQADIGPRVRDELIGVAKRRQTITYGELKAAANLTHPPNGIGRLLDVISEDCRLRGEPSLAPLVVNGETREVGADYEGAPAADRQRLYDYWS